MKHDYFSQIDSEEKAYWLGFLFADGCVREFSDGRKSVNVSQKGADHPALFLKAIESPYTPKLKKNKNGEWYDATIYSHTMFDDLFRLGCVPQKSNILLPPTINLGIYTRDFIRGYNDGDGGFYRNQDRLRMRGTYNFLMWIQSKMPVGSLVYDYSPTAQLFVCKRSVLVDTVDYLYGGATIFMKRKYDVAMSICQ